MEAPITHVELILDTETVGKPFVAYYHDDGTKTDDWVRR